MFSKCGGEGISNFPVKVNVPSIQGVVGMCAFLQVWKQRLDIAELPVDLQNSLVFATRQKGNL